MIEMPKMMPDELRDLRRRLRLTQAEMAHQVGANRTQYANWEYGTASVPDEFVVKFEAMGATSPPTEAPITVRATRTHLSLLIGIICDCSIAQGLRDSAREELERVLGLDLASR